MKKKVILSLAALIICFVGVQVFASVPGSGDDPLITVSYLTKKLQDFSTSIQGTLESQNQKIQQFGETITVLDNKVEEINKKAGQTSSSSFTTISVPEGKKLLGDAGTEIILRAGRAVVISETAEGLSDVTSGDDLKKGVNVPKNHLIIIPRADGRGVTAQVTSYIMVKGGYQIQ